MATRLGGICLTFNTIWTGSTTMLNSIHEPVKVTGQPFGLTIQNPQSKSGLFNGGKSHDTFCESNFIPLVDVLPRALRFFRRARGGSSWHSLNFGVDYEQGTARSVSSGLFCSTTRWRYPYHCYDMVAS